MLDKIPFYHNTILKPIIVFFVVALATYIILTIGIFLLAGAVAIAACYAGYNFLRRHFEFQTPIHMQPKKAADGSPIIDVEYSEITPEEATPDSTKQTHKTAPKPKKAATAKTAGSKTRKKPAGKSKPAAKKSSTDDNNKKAS